MLIRAIEINEAETFLRLTQQIDRERDLTLYQTGEAFETLAQQETQIQAIEQSPNSTLLVALSEEELIGYALAQGGALRIDQHSAIVVVEVVQTMQRKGVATALLQALETWAREARLQRLELTVLAFNHPAIQLYFKCGFEREGVKRQARLIGTEYVDEWMMSKLLGQH